MTEYRIVAPAGSPLGPLYAAVVAAAHRSGGTLRTVTDGPRTALLVDEKTHTEWRAAKARLKAPPVPAQTETPPPDTGDQTAAPDPEPSAATPPVPTSDPDLEPLRFPDDDPESVPESPAPAAKGRSNKKGK